MSRIHLERDEVTLLLQYLFLFICLRWLQVHLQIGLFLLLQTSFWTSDHWQAWPRDQMADSECRKIIVCDNGTGVSILLFTIRRWFVFVHLTPFYCVLIFSNCCFSYFSLDIFSSSKMSDFIFQENTQTSRFRLPSTVLLSFYFFKGVIRVLSKLDESSKLKFMASSRTFQGLQV